MEEGAEPRQLFDVLLERIEAEYRQFLDATKAQGLAVHGDADFVHTLRRVWACSEFVMRACLKEPELLDDLVRSGDLPSEYRPGTYHDKLHRLLHGISTEQELNDRLRRFRRREMLRIAWRDIADWAPLQETFDDLTALADACVDAALMLLDEWQAQELGRPTDAGGARQFMVVVALGKLGGGELNFSSDIDLIFAYPQEGKTRGKRRHLTNEEYFTRLGQRLIHTLDAVTEQGFVFRVDMRLRPFGESGPLALSFGALEEYYQNFGRTWERYAFIKARVAAGARDAGVRLLAILHPFVYRRYLDFAVIDSLREMKRMIGEEAERKGLQRNIKVGAGGIREIEFICQVFQLMRGGRKPPLQVRDTMTVLQRLSDYHYLSEILASELRDAYMFLRKLENRLQQVDDRQTHELPEDEMEQVRLAYAMGYPDWDDLNDAVRSQRDRVRVCFEQLFAGPKALEMSDASVTLSNLWSGSLEEQEALTTLSGMGFDDPPEALRWLHELRASYSYRTLSAQARDRMDRLMPALLIVVSRHDEPLPTESAAPTVTLTRLLRLMEVIALRSTYLALLVEHPFVLSQLTKLCAASPWIAALLTRHPLLLDELIDSRTLYAPLDVAALREQLDVTLLRSLPDQLEQQMESLRHFKQVQVLRVAAADVAGALPVMRVSDHLTAIAEVVLQRVLQIAWRHMTAKHGVPSCVVEGKRRQTTFAIIAYGKLGGVELSYGSDLDLVFLHDSQGEEQRTGGPKAIDSGMFFARLAQRIIHILNSHTPSGVLYDVDIRLRPNGASGLLVSSLESYADYQHKNAWTWEHQALVRARPVAEIGAGDLAGQFNRLRAAILGRERDAAALRSEVLDMRERMYAELNQPGEGWFDLKQGRGGIADIEFMVQYTVLLNTCRHPELSAWTDNIRQLGDLAASGLLSAPDAQALSDAYQIYRAALHRCALQDEPARVPDAEFRVQREAVMRIWHGLMDRPNEFGSTQV